MRRVILAIVATAAGLVALLSFKTHGTTGLASSQSPVIVTPAQNGSSSSRGSTTAPKASASPTRSTGSGGTSGTFTGESVDTIYGPVQVTVTVKGGKVTAVNVPVYPQGTMRDVQINSYAIPQLVQETIAASSANIDGVSGATYTSQGYVGSLQSALDKAGL